ncbi:MAG: SprT-like family protein [Myxococcales bacterium]|nr:MAG: SprT-like family protein [Myxococcales bacterium]
MAAGSVTAARNSPLWRELGPEPASIVSRLAHDEAEIEAKDERVRSAFLAASAHLEGTSFKSLRASDLDTLIALYDAHFFSGWLGEMLGEGTPEPLEVRLSRRMTSVGGSTRRRQHRVRRDGCTSHYHSYEIAVSSVLLFQSFADVERPVVVSGVECSDRLAAMQRIVEHELVHLLEFLVWGRSSCARPRFLTIAGNLFGHTAASHRLVTQTERALVSHGVRVGDWVEFEGDGTRHAGFIRRITKRATVLVDDPDGTPYSDGHRYAKWFVPLPELRKLRRSRSRR